MEDIKTPKRTPKKRGNPKPPFKGVESGVSFTSANQPSPESKSEGWKKKRTERLLTQKILEKITKGKNLDTYVTSLIKNAKKGNPKAIETINKGIEDDILKIAQTDNEGNDVIDLSKVPSDLLLTLLNAVKAK